MSQVKKVKPVPTFTELTVDLTIGLIVTWMNLLDAGIGSYSLSTEDYFFNASWLNFKKSFAPVHYFNLIVTLTLPMALVKILSNAVKTFNHSARAKMFHVYDITQAVTFIGVVIALLTQLLPLTKDLEHILPSGAQFFEATKETKERYALYLADYTFWQYILLVLNIINFGVAVGRYRTLSRLVKATQDQKAKSASAEQTTSVIADVKKPALKSQSAKDDKKKSS